MRLKHYSARNDWVIGCRNLIINALAVAGLGFQVSVSSASPVAYVPSAARPPSIQREYRGVWIASVGNIDWPSTNQLSSTQQKAELLSLLDRAVELKLNTIIFQVRPSCDALYSSQIEPWSEYLTGVMGQAPRPFYDPLLFAIDEAHKRGLELHAWFNPFRARYHAARSPISRNHISRSRPDLVRTYGKHLWLDPGEKEVQTYSISVIMDVVKRYDVDGIHIDDYFYPYKEKNEAGKTLDFPDSASWNKYGVRTGLSREDWRRQNVDGFVRRLNESIHQSKAWVEFGISPFGVWRPGHPAQVTGLDAWGDLYADARKWVREGWADYFVPQLYWKIESPGQSFPALLDWWSEQNVKNRHLLAGLNSAQTRAGWPTDEIARQIRLTRNQPEADGHVHWNMRSLSGDSTLAGALSRNTYQGPALPPPLSWLRQPPPPLPVLKASVSGASVKVSWKSGDSRDLRVWILQSRNKEKWKTEVLSTRTSSRLFVGQLPEVIAVTAVDRFGNTSSPVALAIRK